MRRIGLPGTGRDRHAGGCSYHRGTATYAHAPGTSTNYSELYTTASASATASTGYAAARALRATGPKGPPCHAQTIGDDHSRHGETGHAASAAQTAAGSCLYASSAEYAAGEAAHTNIHSTCAAYRANQCFARCANVA